MYNAPDTYSMSGRWDSLVYFNRDELGCIKPYQAMRLTEITNLPREIWKAPSKKENQIQTMALISIYYHEENLFLPVLDSSLCGNNILSPIIFLSELYVLFPLSDCC